MQFEEGTSHLSTLDGWDLIMELLAFLDAYYLWKKGISYVEPLLEQVYNHLPLIPLQMEGSFLAWKDALASTIWFQSQRDLEG